MAAHAWERACNTHCEAVTGILCADLVPSEVLQQWLKHLREELPTVAFKASTKPAGHIAHAHLPNASKTRPKPRRGAGARAPGPASHSAAAPAELFPTSECIGADMLLQLLKNYCRSAGGAKSSICVGIVGMPNVGKSSVLNSLKRSRVAAVGNTPGVTQNVQEVQLDKKIRLLDSPGVVFSAQEDTAAAALRNAVKVRHFMLSAAFLVGCHHDQDARRMPATAVLHCILFCMLVISLVTQCTAQ